MSMTRSDLPNVGKLAPEVQRQAVDEMWRAWNRGELHGQGPGFCPLSYVATFAEMLEAALGVVASGQKTVSGQRAV